MIDVFTEQNYFFESPNYSNNKLIMIKNELLF